MLRFYKWDTELHLEQLRSFLMYFTHRRIESLNPTSFYIWPCPMQAIGHYRETDVEHITLMLVKEDSTKWKRGMFGACLGKTMMWGTVSCRCCILEVKYCDPSAKWSLRPHTGLSHGPGLIWYDQTAHPLVEGPHQSDALYKLKKRLRGEDFNNVCFVLKKTNSITLLNSIGCYSLYYVDL